MSIPLHRKDPFFDQQPPMLDSQWVVDIEHVQRHATDGGTCAKCRTIPCEVLRPVVAPRIKESRQLSGVGINPGKSSLLELPCSVRKNASPRNDFCRNGISLTQRLTLIFPAPESASFRSQACLNGVGLNGKSRTDRSSLGKSRDVNGGADVPDHR